LGTVTEGYTRGVKVTNTTDARRRTARTEGNVTELARVSDFADTRERVKFSSDT